jgi:predicted nucleotidyltransferase
MSVVGFRECYQRVVRVIISEKPEVAIQVVNLAGLTILKLISWDEKGDRRQKDASDLFFITQNYLDAGNLERLFDEAPDIVASSEYNYEAGSARLLGRDISKIAFPTTKAKLIEILKRESQRKQGHRIAMDILQGNRLVEKPYEEIIALFDGLLKGLTDDKSR